MTSGGVPGGWQWGIISKMNANSNNLLEANEQFTIMANVSDSPPTSSMGIPPSGQFILQIRPPVGAAVPISKSAPGGITNWNLLY
jgi:archaellin